MLWLAASVGIAITASSVGLPQLSGEERQAWQRIEPSVAYIVEGGSRTGVAALVDERGWFVTDEIYVPHSHLTARFSSGDPVQLTLVHTDETTHLALLKATRLPGNRRPAPLYGGTMQGASANASLRLLAALPSGPIRAEMDGPSHPGVMGAARRVVPLSEIHFETPPSGGIHGGLIFTMQGEFVGVLEAALESHGDMAAAMSHSLAETGQKAFGPGRMTVAYSVDPSVIRQVVHGFMTPTHRVEHPAIGVMLKDASGTGAYVHSVKPGSPAAAAGIKTGDIITGVGVHRVHDQIGFAQVMLKQRVGSVVPVRLLRGGRLVTINVRVGD